ncbi:substrate-binding periplasmic protein [Undibacterium sp. SXout11W]|uniref:substrate-binding periplasmic protein n=1 Tax=Undibacterium sp. SXout11W TaxID=3413050 RepID=UPI003BF0CB96
MKNSFSVLKFWVIAVTAIACMLCGWVSATETSLNMIVGNASAPKMFLNADGNPDGYFVALAKEVGRRAGYKVEIISVPWARGLQMAERGEGVICSLSMLPEREKIFKYSASVVVDPVLIVTMKNRNLTASSLADLKGLVVGLNRGSRYGSKFVKELTLVQIDEDNNGLSRIRKLVLGRIDAAIMPGGLAAVKLNAQAANIDLNDLEIQKTPIALDKNYFAIAKLRPDANEVIERLNSAMVAMVADGSMNQILTVWGVQNEVVEKH